MRDEVIVQTSNVRRLANATRTMMLRRAPGLPRIASVTGRVGLGKSTATRSICLDQDAVWVEALPDWTARWMLGDLASELGAERRHRAEDNFRSVIGALRQNPRAVFIDEADRLCRRLNLVETLRAIHDATSAPLVLIGMQELPHAIHRLPQLESRIAHWIEFQPLDLADVRLMGRELCEVALDDDVIAHLHEISGGSARLVRVALERLERLADREGWTRVRWADVPANYDLVYSRRRAKQAPASSPLPPGECRGEGAHNVVTMREAQSA